jgi:ribosomal protein S12 methylthiotransferase
VLVEDATADHGDGLEGRAAHQAPEVDGSTTLVPGGPIDPATLRTGDLVRAKVIGSAGVDLVAVPMSIVSGPSGAASAAP